ncbi:TVP38/TMEM64 family protein [Devriesea agamarum]|uniref:TVP38/TMEM64 family protein n=1 Tax=Devriesea agamarum TaxID=472569 RepID=UPI000B32F034|nr:TVP38/TMEM64 family protein [Devriesea agamarum]
MTGHQTASVPVHEMPAHMSDLSGSLPSGRLLPSNVAPQSSAIQNFIQRVLPRRYRPGRLLSWRTPQARFGAAPSGGGSTAVWHGPWLYEGLEVDPNTPTPIGLKIARWSTPVVMAASVALLIYGYISGAFSSVPELQQTMAELGWWAPILFILLQAVQIVFPVLPGGIGIVAGPILFGPALGSLYNYLGICIGSLYVFHLARMHGVPLILKVFPKKLFIRYRRWTEHPHFTRWFAVAIVLPVAPDDFLCYLAGTTKMSARTYWLIILLGKPWSILAYSFGLIYLMNMIPGVHV